MENLTVFILPSGGTKKSLKKLMDSFSGISCIFFILSNAESLLEQEINTEWYCFLYDNEWLEKDLTDFIPTLLKANQWDYYLIHKKVKIDGKNRFFIVPRIFREKVKLKANDFTPLDTYLPYERVLEGWILEEDRIA